MRDYKAENQGFLTFGKGVGLGAMSSLIGGVVYGVFLFIYSKFINTGYVDTIREVAYQQMEAQSENNPAMTDEAMEMAMKWTGKNIFDPP